MPPFDSADLSSIRTRGIPPASGRRLASILALTVVLSAGAVSVCAQETAPAAGPRGETSVTTPAEPPAAAPAPAPATASSPAPEPAVAPATQAPADGPISSQQPTAPATQPAAPVSQPAAQVSQPVAPVPQPAGEEAPAGEETVLPTVSGDARLPHDLSPLGMFMAADWVVKAVMLGLAFASLVTWTIWLAKVLELASASARARRALRRLEAAETLAAVSGQGRWARRGPVAALVEAAHAEVARSAGLAPSGVKERAVVALSRIEARAGRRMARGTGLLATIGSTAPFVGLFGTVWGIMNAFIGISQANTTNLAVVAPGIAEALLATAIGLVAAIPAVIVYNVFSRSIAGYRALLSDASAEVLRHLSRDLDRQQRGLAAPAAE